MNKREFIINISKDIMIAYINNSNENSDQNTVEQFDHYFPKITNTIATYYNSFDNVDK